MLDKNENKKVVMLNSLDTEERLMVKKMILGDEATIKKIKLVPLDFDTAIMQEKPMTISVPHDIVKKLKNDYISKICENSIDNDKQIYLTNDTKRNDYE